MTAQISGKFHPDTMRTLAHSGRSYSDAARILGTSESGVRQAAVRMGIEFQNGRGKHMSDKWADADYRANQTEAIRRAMLARAKENGERA